MISCLELLNINTIGQHYIEDAIKQKFDHIVKYLIRKRYYTDYNDAAVLAAKLDNYEIINWLLDEYHTSNFNVDMIRKHINYSRIQNLLDKLNSFALVE
jgi:hypothetical protein